MFFNKLKEVTHSFSEMRNADDLHAILKEAWNDSLQWRKWMNSAVEIPDMREDTFCIQQSVQDMIDAHKTFLLTNPNYYQ